jgi:hypothetical protein
MINTKENKYKKIKINKIFSTPRNKNDKIKFNTKNKLASLELENISIYKRINNATSFYQNKNFKKDYELSQAYKTNICKLPKINFKNYKKKIKVNETPKKHFKLNFNNLNIFNTNLTLTTKNRYNYDYDDLEDIDSISLYFFLSPNIKDHPYIIIVNPDDLFFQVIQKLCDTVPYIEKDKLIAFKYEDENKIEIEMYKTVKDNGLTDKCKIIVEFG